jgi:hypothetical protein
MSNSQNSWEQTTTGRKIGGGKKRALEIFKFDERSSDRKKKEKIKD